MAENIFYCLMLVLFFSFSMGAIEYSYVNRTFELLLRASIEISVMTLGEDEEPTPYFNEEKVSANLERYFSENLPRYVHDYQYEYYFTYKDRGGYCLDGYCDAIKISLKANIAGMFSFNKAKTYFISEGRLFDGA